MNPNSDLKMVQAVGLAELYAQHRISLGRWF